MFCFSNSEALIHMEHLHQFKELEPRTHLSGTVSSHHDQYNISFSPRDIHLVAIANALQAHLNYPSLCPPIPKGPLPGAISTSSFQSTSSIASDPSCYSSKDLKELPYS